VGGGVYESHGGEEKDAFRGTERDSTVLPKIIGVEGKKKTARWTSLRKLPQYMVRGNMVKT